MKIFLTGYMGSGKSVVGKLVASHLGLKFCDLDKYITEKVGKEIKDIFSENGEIYFRKLENQCLLEVLTSEKKEVIALGGGTPCYGNNLEIIKSSENKLFYLKMDVGNLTERLFRDKMNRPMIAHYTDKNKLEEFIRKHLFERNFYYLQSDSIINVEDKSAVEIANEIVADLD